MCLKGDWREDKDVEMELDGIGGVSILVKADVHRSGKFASEHFKFCPRALLTRGDRNQLSDVCL